MHKFMIILLLTTFLFSCDIRHTKTKQDVTAVSNAVGFKDSTSVQMIDSVYNFGKITEGDKVEYNFRFRNTGKNPLIITAATASCGCTVPEKPDEPVKPGETGFLKVVFNSKGKMGDIHKEVDVTSNAYPGFPKLALIGEVLTKANNQ